MLLLLSPPPLLPPLLPPPASVWIALPGVAGLRGPLWGVDLPVWIRGHSCVAVCSGDEQRGRTLCLVVRGCSAEAGRPFLAGGWARFGGGGGGVRQKAPWLLALRRPTAAGTQWVSALTRPPISALVGESLILTPLGGRNKRV